MYTKIFHWGRKNCSSLSLLTGRVIPGKIPLILTPTEKALPSPKGRTAGLEDNSRRKSTTPLAGGELRALPFYQHTHTVLLFNQLMPAVIFLGIVPICIDHQDYSIAQMHPVKCP